MSGDGREIFEHLRGDRLAETGVMRAARVNPRRAGVLEIRPAFPHRRATGSFGIGCSGATTSTSLMSRRKRLPKSISAAFSAAPAAC
jgi:hypothetical protein